MCLLECVNSVGKYLTAEVAKKIEHSIQTKEKWEKTIPVPVTEFIGDTAV